MSDSKNSITKEALISYMLEKGWEWVDYNYPGKVRISKGGESWVLDAHTYSISNLLDAMQFVNFRLGMRRCRMDGHKR